MATRQVQTRVVLSVMQVTAPRDIVVLELLQPRVHYVHLATGLGVAGTPDVLRVAPMSTRQLPAMMPVLHVTPAPQTAERKPLVLVSPRALGMRDMVPLILA
jgi:hypothetical protein